VLDGFGSFASRITEQLNANNKLSAFSKYSAYLGDCVKSVKEIANVAVPIMA
jgi:hypothetical protein